MTVLDRPLHRPAADPAELLIKEAHRRKRRRRALIAGIAAVVLAAAIAGPLLADSGGHPVPGPAAAARQPRRPDGPVVDATAFAGHGQLAFVSRGTLWVLDGSDTSHHPLRQVATPGLVPVDPTFSPDGRWLAFVAQKERTEGQGAAAITTVVSSSLWMARADGTGAHPVAGIDFDQAFGWSPHADRFAVSVGKATTVPFGVATGVDLVSPTGSTTPLVSGTHVTSAAWAPDGSRVAVSTEAATDGYAPELATYPADGGPPTTWAGGPTFSSIVLAGWWPTWGILYTTVGEGGVPGGSVTKDGSPLLTLAQPGGTPRLLGTTLQDDGAGAPSAGPAGRLAFVGVEGGGMGRMISQDQQVEVCSPATLGCAPVPHPAGTVTLDPAWSPQGTLAYVQAPVSLEVGRSVATWYGVHRLLLFDPTKGSTAAAPQTPGATVPAWSADGTSLLYVSSDGLWLGAAPGGAAAAKPVEVARPLFPPGDWKSYYGQIAFSSQFAWSQGGQVTLPPWSDAPL